MYEISDPTAPHTQVTFYETGSFQVVFETWTVDGQYYYLWQNVTVVDSGSTDYGDNQPPPADVADYVGDYNGGLSDPAGWAHEIAFSVDQDGNVDGWSLWAGGLEFDLMGYVTADGYIYFEDDAADWSLPVGIYVGEWTVPGTGDPGFAGTYYEDDLSNPIGPWVAVPSMGG
jgi:hypothetical protein